LILLASSVAQVNFNTGMPIPGAEPAVVEQKAESGLSKPAAGSENRIIFQALLALATGGFAVAFVVFLVRKTNPRQLAFMALGILVCVLLLVILQWTPASAPGVAPLQSGETPLQSIPRYSIEPIGPPPAGLTRAVLIGFAIGLAALTGWLISKSIPRRITPDPITLEAQSALKALESGQGYKNVIIRCYGQMLAHVKNELGFERAESLTPREFEQFLFMKGIPVESISQLTRLFEKARYGKAEYEPQDEQDAVNCLSSIMRSGRETP
jgi:hypothetical protein